MTREKIPETDSIQELARFWDTHDLTDFEGELEDVTEPVFERETVVTVRLPSKDAQALREIAESKGVDSADLVREWILQKVQSS